MAINKIYHPNINVEPLFEYDADGEYPLVMLNLLVPRLEAEGSRSLVNVDVHHIPTLFLSSKLEDKNGMEEGLITSYWKIRHLAATLFC